MTTTKESLTSKTLALERKAARTATDYSLTPNHPRSQHWVKKRRYQRQCTETRRKMTIKKERLTPKNPVPERSVNIWTQNLPWSLSWMTRKLKHQIKTTETQREMTTRKERLTTKSLSLKLDWNELLHRKNPQNLVIRKPSYDTQATQQ